MRKSISYDIVKKVSVKDSPFSGVIYIYKNQDKILIEDLRTGKCVETNSHHITKYINIVTRSTDWMRSFDHTYVKFENDRVLHFMPHYLESNRYATLSIKIIRNTLPRIRYKQLYNPATRRYEKIADNNVSPENPKETTYDYLFQNVKNFKTNNFDLQMLLTEDYEYVDEEFKPYKTPCIECRLPLFQLYSILYPIIQIKSDGLNFSYEQALTVMKFDNKFYRFAYGNSAGSDRICLGSNGVLPEAIYADSIRDLSYARLVTSEFNGDYVPHLKFNNQIPTTLDIDWIRTKVNNNDLEISFIDMLFYLSQCETIEEINKNVFILSPHVPQEILKFENALQSYWTNSTENSEELTATQTPTHEVTELTEEPDNVAEDPPNRIVVERDTIAPAVAHLERININATIAPFEGERPPNRLEATNETDSPVPEREGNHTIAFDYRVEVPVRTSNYDAFADAINLLQETRSQRSPTQYNEAQENDTIPDITQQT